MNSKTRSTQGLLVLAAGVVCLAFSLSMSAQVQSTTTTTSHPASVQTTVERGEVVLVDGRDLIIRMEDGTLRHFSNVPDSARAMVDGKEVGIRDAKVGMKLEKTVTVTTTPKTVTTVQTVTGKVWRVTPPTSVILTLEDGSNQQFTIPRGQTFNVNGRDVDAFGLRKGMTISATKITEVPETLVQHQQKLTGSMPPPPPPPPPAQPILVAVLVPTPAPAAAPAELPKTGSLLPLIGLLGFLSLAASLGLRAVRSSN